MTRATYFDGNATWFATGDFNRDGLPDMASVDGGFGVYIAMGTGRKAAFGAATYYVTSDPAYSYSTSVTTGDLNADGNLDVVVGAETQVTVLLGTGTGSFTRDGQVTIAPRPSPSVISTATAGSTSLSPTRPE